ncbi:MAG: DNA repair protein RecN [candidate division Zixibacteria bacterium]|nr:DNA repair protein RecN [candidate division Zixibacteria bacterium]NIS48497.1 DNA repair protein RecN [candidate division Zixibacteria bacterium]NIV08734.1 DNA repair protein RecN [candidate division Zixibacteria bacterium]NIW40218.1 DNA repair protein RecN [candidate division Zixibacteria bacterium]NIX58977.1 DNA repair protein RecN [candidate division Zixibacteria bacterium]
MHISNFAIVSDLKVEFFPGMNILSGETGAGKSIIIGALNLLLGERAQTEMIRSGSEMAVVEGHFKASRQVSRILKELDMEAQTDTIEIRREIRKNASSRCFLNGQMVTVSDLKKLGLELVDLVGQHHQQLLLNPANHVRFLDDFAGNQNNLEKYHELYNKYQSAKTKLIELKSRVAREKEKMELYRFQIQEIDAAKLSLEEEEELNRERRILENAETLKTSYYSISERLYHGEESVTELLNEALGRLEPLEKYDASLDDSLDIIKSSLFNLEEAGRNLERRSQEIEHDSERLQKIQERLDIYYNLKKKYGGSLEQLFKYREEIGAALNSFSDSSADLDNLMIAVETDLKKLCELADRLSDARHDSATALSKKVEKELTGLLMGKVDFEVKITADESYNGEYKREGMSLSLGPDGYDSVEFLFSPNPGEEKKPLSKIASGGELSRVLLAIKTIVSGKNKSSSLIFDEIDSGIGGKTASAVGRSLQNLAKKHQVLVITHLQQIAAFGESHFLVFKEKSNGRMITQIRKLTLKQRKEELGRMISGEKVTELSLKQAEELLEKGRK